MNARHADTAQAGRPDAPHWLADQGEWIDPLGFAALLSHVLWESYGQELKASWPGDPQSGATVIDEERVRRTSRWLA